MKPISVKNIIPTKDNIKLNIFAHYNGAPIDIKLGAKGAGFSNIIAVRQIFASDLGLLVGWTHYLVFDLFIGAWEARDAARRHIPHFILIPCLLLTFIFGPVGLCLYLVLRRTSKKAGAALDETGTL